MDVQEDEEIDDQINTKLDLPELPQTFNVWAGSMSADDSSSRSHPPSDFSPFTFSPFDEPPDDCFGIVNESSQGDVFNKEKEIVKPPQTSINRDKRSISPPLNGSDLKNDLEQTINFIEPYIDPSVDPANNLTSNEVKIVNEEQLQLDNGIHDCKLENDLEDEDRFSDLNAIKLEVESLDLKTENIQQIDEPFSDHSYQNFNIPEAMAELTLDDDDGDDFNDFETAFPVDRLVENIEIQRFSSQLEHGASETDFVADFSEFNTFSNSEVITNDTAFAASTEILKEDDDDFGDFSEFTQAPVAISAVVAVTKPSNVCGVLHMMFPNAYAEEESLNKTDFAKEQSALRTDGFVSKFNDFDSTLALGYLYSNSNASQTLVKALGIDTRNIVRILKAF